MKKPFVTAAQLEDIAARYPTPFHLYDEQGIRENARQTDVRSRASGRIPAACGRHLPGIPATGSISP